MVKGSIPIGPILSGKVGIYLIQKNVSVEYELPASLSMSMQRTYYPDEACMNTHYEVESWL